MKIHAFKVEVGQKSAPLEDTLNLIKSEADLSRRVRLISQSETRAEWLEKRDGLWYLDFVKFRTTQGPGKAKRRGIVEGFTFAQGESFGEETAALYDPKTGFILVQYNHSGIRAGAIAQYLSEFNGAATNDYNFLPKFDPETERRLVRKTIKKRLLFKIDVNEMDAEDIKQGVALADAVALGRSSAAGQVEIELTATGGGQGLGAKVGDILTAVQNLYARNPAAVKSLKVAGKIDADDALEVLDLLKQRLYVQLDDIRPGADLRLPLSERWKGLDRAKNAWKRYLK